MEKLKNGSDVLFILLGAVMVLAMHAGFAFLELGTVRRKNQVNALVKILVRLRGVDRRVFLHRLYARLRRQFSSARSSSREEAATSWSSSSSCSLSPRRFRPSSRAASPSARDSARSWRRRSLLVGLVYPFFEGIAWNEQLRRAGVDRSDAPARSSTTSPARSSSTRWAAGSALPAVILLGARSGRYRKDGAISAHPPSSIPFLALGAWILTVGWFGFNVMSAQTIDKISGLVAVNSLMAMVGGTLAALLVGRNDPGFVHNGPLAGPGRGLRRLRPHASDRRAGHRRDRRRACSS